MIIGEKELRKMYPELDDDQYQPNSIDLKLGKVYRIMNFDDGTYGLYNGEKHIPNKVEICYPYKNRYILYPNKPYWLEIEPKIEIPEDIAQFYLPRSSLLRMGVTLHTALGDSGFNGHLMFLAINHMPYDIRLDKGERIATAINFEVDSAGLYDGDYNE